VGYPAAHEADRVRDAGAVDGDARLGQHRR
jgi:hypothetical protein